MTDRNTYKIQIDIDIVMAEVRATNPIEIYHGTDTEYFEKRKEIICILSSKRSLKTLVNVTEIISNKLYLIF